MKKRRLVMGAAAGVLVGVMALAFLFLRTGQAVGRAQGVETQEGIGVTGKMGFLIEKVEPGSPAAQVGLMPGDLIVSIGGRRVRSTQDMQLSLRDSLNSNVPVDLSFMRYDSGAGRLISQVMTVTPVKSDTAASTMGREEMVSGGILNGKAIEKPAPVYPEIARAARAFGTVTVLVVVDVEGKVESAEAVGGHPLLQSAAVDAARQARFSPTRLSGVPVKVKGVLTYDFVRQ